MTPIHLAGLVCLVAVSCAAALAAQESAPAAEPESPAQAAPPAVTASPEASGLRLIKFSGLVRESTWSGWVHQCPQQCVCAHALPLFLGSGSSLGQSYFSWRLLCSCCAKKIAPPPAATQRTATLLVADFDNRTSDTVFDGTLEPMLTLTLEGAPFIACYDRGAARRVAGQLQSDAGRMGESLARLVAVREGGHAVVAGSITREGEAYRISVSATEAATGKPIVRAERKVASKEEVLAAVGKLAGAAKR